MTWVEPGRWSCPGCRATVVPEGSPREVAVTIAALQRAHGTKHLAERVAKVRALSRPGGKSVA